MTPKKVPGHGPSRARVMLVGEAPGANEEREGIPFVGASGLELDCMLATVGIQRADCYTTNICKYRPPKNDIKQWISTKKKDVGTAAFPLSAFGRSFNQLVAEGLNELPSEVMRVNPNIIIAFGDVALWALTGHSGIGRYRGSMLNSRPVGIPGAGTARSPKVIPTYHPAAILRQWSWRPLVMCDLKRAAAEVAQQFWSVPGPDKYKFQDKKLPAHVVIDILKGILVWLDGGTTPLACDIETRRGFIETVGLAWSAEAAICIPFIDFTCPENHAYNLDEEIVIRDYIKQVLTHRNARVIFQNGMYDLQYFIREEGYCPQITDDTMLAQHAMFPGMQKDLNSLSSLWCDWHVYWKDEGKEADPRLAQPARWTYNCKDTAATYEILQKQLRELGDQMCLQTYQFLLKTIKPLQAMMLKGIRLDHDAVEAESLTVELEMEIALGQLELRWGAPINPRSSPQLLKLFYDELGLKPQLDKKTRRPTANEEALRQLVKENPWVELIANPILEYRQNGVYQSTFLGHGRSPDGRFHTSFNPGGPETYRFSSQANAYHEGCNGQNLPPRFRRFLLPDPGYELEDWDLDRADAQVVAWDAGDNRLKEIFRRGDNIHVQNCRLIFPQTKTWSDEAIQASAKDPNPALKFYTLTKSAVHAINYGVFAKTLSLTLGCTKHEADRIIRMWLGEHPAIGDWHDRIEEQLQKTRTVFNAFGFRRVYFDRMSPKMVQEALAWIGQSTVAVVITKGLLNIYDELPEVDLLLQVHDSLLMQVPIDRRLELRPKIKKCLSIVIPYDDPLVINTGGKASEVNWYECEDFDC